MMSSFALSAILSSILGVADLERGSAIGCDEGGVEDTGNCELEELSNGAGQVHAGEKKGQLTESRHAKIAEISIDQLDQFTDALTRRRGRVEDSNARKKGGFNAGGEREMKTGGQGAAFGRKGKIVGAGLQG